MTIVSFPHVEREIRGAGPKDDLRSDEVKRKQTRQSIRVKIFEPGQYYKENWNLFFLKKKKNNIRTLLTWQVFSLLVIWKCLNTSLRKITSLPPNPKLWLWVSNATDHERGKRMHWLIKNQRIICSFIMVVLEYAIKTQFCKAQIISNLSFEHDNEISVVKLRRCNWKPLVCGAMGDSLHGCEADKYVASVWCYHGESMSWRIKAVLRAKKG